MLIKLFWISMLSCLGIFFGFSIWACIFTFLLFEQDLFKPIWVVISYGSFTVNFSFIFLFVKLLRTWIKHKEYNFSNCFPKSIRWKEYHTHHPQVAMVLCEDFYFLKCHFEIIIKQFCVRIFEKILTVYFEVISDLQKSQWRFLLNFPVVRFWEWVLPMWKQIRNVKGKHTAFWIS